MFSETSSQFIEEHRPRKYIAKKKDAHIVQHRLDFHPERFTKEIRNVAASKNSSPFNRSAAESIPFSANLRRAVFLDDKLDEADTACKKVSLAA